MNNKDQAQNPSMCKFSEDLQPLKPKTLIDKIIIGFTSTNILVTSVLLVLLITIATFTRYLIQADLYGYDEWAKLLAMWLYFMGAAYGAFNESHVTADIVTAFTSDSLLRRSIIVLKDVISVGVCLLFLYYAWDFFYFGFTGPLGTGALIPSTSVWRIPMWTYSLAILSGLAIMAYYLIKYFLRDMLLFFRALRGDI